MKNPITPLVLFCLATVSLNAWTFNNVDVHGFFDQGYMASTGNNYYGPTKDGTFSITQGAINASVNINDRLRVGGELYTFRLGDMGDLSNPQIDWLLADYRWKDWLNFRIGKVKMPGALYNEALDLEMSRPFIFLPQGVYPITWRDFNAGAWAVEAYGSVDIKKYGSVDYTFLVGKHKVRSTSGFLQGLSNASSVNINKMDEPYTVVSQLIWNTPTKGLRLNGVAGYSHRLVYSGTFKTADELAALPPPLQSMVALGTTYGGTPTKVKDPSVFYYTIGGEYLWRNWTFAVEYWQLMTKMLTYVDSPTASGSLNGGEAKYKRTDDLYFSVTRQFTKEIEVGAYYSLFFANIHDRNGSKVAATGNNAFSAFQKDFALALRYKISPHWEMKIEGHLVDGTGATWFSRNQPWQDEKRNWTYGAIKSIFFF